MTLPSPSEPSAKALTSDTVPTADGSSPSAVEQHERDLILRHTHLMDELPKLAEDAARHATYFREAKDEIHDIERLLRAHKRLREPIRRKR